MTYWTAPGIIDGNSMNEDNLIIKYINKVEGVDLRLKTRKREVVEARQLAMYIHKKETAYSLSKIGNICGGKDHATVMHAIKTISNLLNDSRFLKKHRKVIEMYNLK